MSVKFKKLAIASAVGATLGMAGVAQAEVSLLFPFITTGASAYTFITLYQDPDRNFVAGNQHPVGVPPHDAYVHNLFYGYKGVNARATDPCVHLDFPVAVTEAALLQFEVGGKFNLISDFGDPAGYGSTLTLENNKVPANSQGFLIVEHNAPAGVTADSMRRGEAIVVDTASGLALSYTAIPTAAGAITNPDFSLVAGAGSSEFVTSWFPKPLITTTWYALPLGARSAMTPNNGGGLNASISPMTNIANVGAYARAENYTSGSRQNNLRCFGSFALTDLLDAPFTMGGWMSIAATAQGAGYGNAPAVAADAAGLSGDLPIALWKLQQSNELGSSVTVINAVQPR